MGRQARALARRKGKRKLARMARIFMGPGISEDGSGKDVEAKRKGHKTGQGGSDDDVSKDGESGSKQGKSKTDDDESSDVSETVDGKRYGKRRSKGDKSENDKKGNA